MIFNSYLFLGIFLPVVAVLFYFPGLQVLRPTILLAASLIFYGTSGLDHLAVLLVDIVWVFALTRIPGYRKQPVLLVFAVVVPVLFLLYYKYLGFLLSDVLQLDIAGAVGPETFDLFKDVVLPAGISFFTFQAVSYAIDTYRDPVAPAPSLQTFALYISFFPQLVAGPIVRFAEVRDQLQALSCFKLTQDRLATGISFAVLGLAVKVLIADTLGTYIDPMLSAPGSGTPILASYVVFAYSFQIYFDFYGYSMIAIGLGLMFGISLPVNFARPYEALNPKDFWRRWHITLSFWIRDYLYLPLGGNRKYIRNILIVFAITGLWHGAGWNFIIWGLFHGLLVMVYHFTRAGWDRVPAVLQTGFNFVLVSFAWLLFIYDFPGLKSFFTSLLGQGTANLPNPDFNMWLTLGIAGAVCFGLDFDRIANTQGRSSVASKGYALALAGILVLAVLFVDQSNTFIYFRF